MAIIGIIEDILKQNILTEGVGKGLKYLQETSLLEVFTQIENGESNLVEIDGRSLFAVFSTYKTKVNMPPVFEGHRKYIDIQFIIKGEESIFVTSSEVADLNEYSSENDCQLCKSQNYSTFLIQPGTAAIFYPEDWHAPGQQSVQPEQVFKVVVKVVI